MDSTYWPMITGVFVFLFLVWMSNRLEKGLKDLVYDSVMDALRDFFDNSTDDFDESKKVAFKKHLDEIKKDLLKKK